MAIVNSSVPSDVKRAFDRAFAGQNKAAVMARLMCQAVEERRRQRLQVMHALLALRRRARPVSGADVRRARAKARR